MSVTNSLGGDAITAARAIGAPSNAIRSIPWIELETKSGRYFEVVPKAQTINGVEELGIEVVQVAKFSAPSKWPNGPLEVKNDLAALRPFLSKTIASARIESLGSDGLGAFAIWFSNGSECRIVHDQSVPQSLYLETLVQSVA